MTSRHHTVPADQRARELCVHLCEIVSRQTKIPFDKFPVDDMAKSVLQIWQDFPEETEAREMLLGLTLRTKVGFFVRSNVRDKQFA